MASLEAGWKAGWSFPLASGEPTLPAEGSQSQRCRQRLLSTGVHRGDTAVGAEWTAAGINRAASPGPAPRSVQNGDLGSAEGKEGGDLPG